MGKRVITYITYRKMNRLYIIGLLLCTLLVPARAQLVDPDDGPDLKWEVAEMDGTKYTSLTEAFEAVGTDGKEIALLIGVIQDGTSTLSADYNTTFDLSAYSLTCASGTTFDISLDKTLELKNGTLSGSFILDGAGNLFAGTDVKMPGVGVTGGTPAQSLYRVLIKLPGNEAAGKVTTVSYGKTRVSRLAQKGDMLCCWLPQSMATVAVTFTYTPAGTATPKTYTTDPLTVTQQAENLVVSWETAAANPDVDVAELTVGAATTGYATLKEAFDALSGEATVKLLANASLAEVLETAYDVTFDLNNWQLTASGSAGFKVADGKRLRMRSGNVTGGFTVEGEVVADRTVNLPAAAVSQKKGGTQQQVYRTRLVLPGGTADRDPVVCSYGSEKGLTATALIEAAAPVAYLWLPAHAAAPFTLTISGNSLTKEGVLIQANHDNQTDLRTGDSEAVLYAAGQTPGTDAGTPYATFHTGLNEAGTQSGSQLWLLRNVSLSGENVHSHLIGNNVRTELHLDGHTLTGENCMLDASAAGACLRICDADRGTGRITGTFRIKGNIYIGKDVASANIGLVLDENGDQLYRVLVTVNAVDAVDGLATYSLGALTGQACFIREKVACLWLPASVQPETLTLSVSGNTYTAAGVQVIASHANTVIVREPAVVAVIGSVPYTSLADAFAAAAGTDKIVLQQNTKLDVPVTVTDTKQLKLDLREYTLDMATGAGFSTSGSGSLDIYSSLEKGVMPGNFSVTDAVCVESSVSLSGLVTLNGKTVYRTAFSLPRSADGGTWSFHDAQSGTLFFTGKPNGIGQSLAYGWLQAEGGAYDLKTILTGTVSRTCTLADIMIQATHNNRFDMEAGKNVAMVGTQYYASFATALEAVLAADGGTVKLVADQTLRGMQMIGKHVVIDLNGKKLSLASDAAFDVSATLVIIDGSGASMKDKGYLYGTVWLNGLVYVSPDVKMSGTVVCAGDEVYRLSVEGLPVSASLPASSEIISYDRPAGGTSAVVLTRDGNACLWLPVVTDEEDIRFSISGETYETTLQPGLPEHNIRSRAYRLVGVDADATWTDGANQGCNVAIAPGKTLTIATSGQLKTLHRVTMGNASQLVCEEAVLATGGIVYRRTFAESDHWEAFSLPYAPRSITAVLDGKPVELSPYLVSGTGGHFWLQTLAEGSFGYVAEERLQANTGYIIAVPEGLTTKSNPDMAISFVSSPNQYLNRKPLEVAKPSDNEFRQQTTGVLYAYRLSVPFYRLNADGTEYIRQQASAANPVEIPPFNSYLLTDERTLATHASLRMAGLPTANETLLPVSGKLQVQGGRGGIRVHATTATPLYIYTYNGRLYRMIRVPAGETFLPLAGGLYLVNREKVFVTE